MEMRSLQVILLHLASVILAAPSSSEVFPRAPSNAPIVSVKNGSYYGSYSATYDQDLFLGIPFAQPPLEDLRWRNPQSLNSTWTVARSATTYAPVCLPRRKPWEFEEDEIDFPFLGVLWIW